MTDLKAEFEEVIEDASPLLIFNMAQDLVQDAEGKEAQALNLIVGSSFALCHALNYYKEVTDGKSVKHSSGTADSENGSRLS